MRQGEPLPQDKPAKQARPKGQKIKRTRDPRLASAARELRDRWLEQVNGEPVNDRLRLGLIAKYDVSRALAGDRGGMPMLPAA